MNTILHSPIKKHKKYLLNTQCNHAYKQPLPQQTLQTLPDISTSNCNQLKSCCNQYISIQIQNNTAAI